MDQQANTKTVVIVDDDPGDRIILREAIQRAELPYQCHILKDGEQLEDFLYGRHEFAGQSNKPDLILLDIWLPRKDGHQLLSEIRSSPEHQHIPVVFLTGSKYEREIQAADAQGVSSYHVKPEGFEELVQLLGQICRTWLETGYVYPS
jgi:CheY-like chemotaxis protein